MKLKMTVLVAAGALLSVGAVSAQAQDVADLLKSKNCMNCHAIDAKKMGPSYKELTAKYANDRDAVATIVARLKEGRGHVKPPSATDEEIKTMVEFALGQK